MSTASDSNRPTAFEAYTSIVYGNLGADGLTVKLEREAGRWKMVEAEDTWPCCSFEHPHLEGGRVLGRGREVHR